MRWPLMLRQTNVAEADGEVVLSRSPDAGIKLLAGRFPREATVARSPAHRGDHV